MWNLKINDTNELTYKMKETQGLTKITYSCWRGRDTKGLWEGHEHTAIFKVDSQQRPTVYSTGNSAQCSVPARMGGEFGG